MLITKNTWGDSRADWRYYSDSRRYMTREMFDPYFEYLRQTNQQFEDIYLINILKSINGNLESKKAFLAANPPVDPTNIYKIAETEGVYYLIKSNNPRESLVLSNVSGKLIKANMSPAQAARLLGTTPAAAQGAGQAVAAPLAPGTRGRGRPAGVPNAPRQQAAAAPAAAGDINIATEMNEIGLETAFLRLPRAIMRRLNVTNAVRVDPNGDRGAARRNNYLGDRGRVGRVIAVGSSKIYIIRLANQQVIASINVQPGNHNYILTPNANGNVAIHLNSPADLVNVLTQRGLAEARHYIMREYIHHNPQHIDEVKKLLKQHIAETRTT
jgi:hypothetical protein